MPFGIAMCLKYRCILEWVYFLLIPIQYHNFIETVEYKRSVNCLKGFFSNDPLSKYVAFVILRCLPG